MNDRQTPMVSIITKAYNVEKYIRQCADSVLGQSFQDFEWIVLENGSTDRTGTILKEYAQKDSRIRLFVNEKNYNKVEPSEDGYLCYRDLLKVTEGKYIADLDSDDFLHRDFLKNLLEATNGDDMDIVVAGYTAFQDDDPNNFGVTVPKAFRDEDIAELGNNINDLYSAFNTTWGKLISRDIYVNNMEYIFNRPSYVVNGGDTFSCLRMLQIAKKCICIDKPLYYYRIRLNSTACSNVYPERYLSQDAVFYEGLRLLKMWNKNSTDNFIRLCFSHLVGLKRNLEVLATAENISLKKRLDFTENVLNDEVYNQYISSFADEDIVWFESVLDAVLEYIYCKEEQGKDSLFYAYNFSRRFVSKRFIQNKQFNDYDIMLYVVSAASMRNTVAYDNKFLEVCMKHILGNECASLSEVRSVLSKYTHTSELEKEKKMRVSALLAEERYSEAMEVLQTFGDHMKMDCDILFAKACCCNAVGDLKSTLTLLAIANELYPDEEVIRENLDYILGLEE